MTADTADGVREARRARQHAIRAEVAQEEAKAAEAEVAERAAALDVPLHLRIDRELDAQLRRQAAEAQLPTSALVRRLLRQAVQQPREQLTTADVESIARRSRARSCTAREATGAARNRPQPGSQVGSQLRESLHIQTNGFEPDHGADLRVHTMVDRDGHRLSPLKSVGSAVRSRP